MCLLFNPANLAFCFSYTAYKFMKPFDNLSALQGHAVMKTNVLLPLKVKLKT